jgi:ABC-2 type transport system permease protein
MRQHLALTLRLHGRRPMALVYSYLFPVLFLVAFWVLYRHEAVPLVRHMGALLTVTALGGACFGLPTALVAERELGVWRRYRLAPVSTTRLLAGTLFARYLLLLSAAALQVALAMTAGMPAPGRPGDLWIAFTLVSIAMLGLGLLIAALADTVPAVQALGQCIFLPMLIVGGVAVRLDALPLWAQHVSAFLPGRYAVQALQIATDGGGLDAAVFSAAALVAIGLAAAAAGVATFRWDAQQKFAAAGGKGWLVVALGAWLAVGLAAEATGVVRRAAPAAQRAAASAVSGAALPAGPVPQATEPSAVPAPGMEPPAAAARVERNQARRDQPAASGQVSESTDVHDAEQVPAEPAELPAPQPRPERTWRDVTPSDIEVNLVFVGLPPDHGVVTPIATGGYRNYGDIACMKTALPSWPPGAVADPLQRAYNLLYLAAVPDVLQMPIEHEVPLVVFERLQESIPRESLIRILYWVAVRPWPEDISALDQLPAACLNVWPPDDLELVHERVGIYATKLLGRLLGRL